MTNRIPHVLLAAYVALFIWGAIAPYDRAVWWVENVPIVLVVLTLVILYMRGVRFSALAYILMSILPYWHTIGGHYTFERVPFDWFGRAFGFERNMYDRIGHFSVGFYAFGIAEYLITRKRMSVALACLFAIFAISFVAMSYELIEWIYAAYGGNAEAGADFLGSQGDIWDAQKDMLMDTLGAIASILLYLTLRNRGGVKKYLGLLLVLLTSPLSAQSTVSTIYDRVILGGRVMDPASKLDAVRNIGIVDGRIAVIAAGALRGRDTIDARGLVVAPGFIDIHAHGQTPETYRLYSLDGVTTALELELGTSDVDGWYRERSAGERINYGVSIGHIKVRMAVMHDSGTIMPVGNGAYRAATPAQIVEIAKRIETGLGQGAVDIGAGFPYTPAATREELLAVFRVAAKARTPIHVHITPGAAGLKEVLSLARQTHAPLHVVHINSAALAETPVMLSMIGAARALGRDVTTEAYPYDAGMTEIKSATIQDIYKTAPDARLAELEWQKTGERLNRESFDRYSRTGGPVVVHTNTEPMVAAAIKSPLTIIASDAYWQNGTGHPRTTGTFSRVLGRYVRENHSLTLMEAIRKMTLMPAQRLEARVPAMRQKGRLRVGADADITIFDPRTVVDRSTYREPTLSPVGIQHVIVSGVSVVTNGRAVEGVTPGKAVRAPTTRMKN